MMSILRILQQNLIWSIPAVMIALAYILQVQSAAWHLKWQLRPSPKDAS